MTEAEYREFIELEKNGEAKDFYRSAYPEVRADVHYPARYLDCGW